MIMASTSTVNSQALLSSKVGLSLFSAAVFIVGEMAGSGILALPAAVANAGKLVDQSINLHQLNESISSN
jgi:hypothetical protein